MLLIDNHRGFPLLVPPLPPTPKKTKEENKREEKPRKGSAPRPLAHLPATPSPPLWIRQSSCLPSGVSSRNTLTRQGQRPDPPPPAAANDQHTNKAKAKKRPHPLVETRNPTQPTPARCAGVPYKSVPAAKTPTIEIAGAKQTNNENAVVKIP